MAATSHSRSVVWGRHSPRPFRCLCSRLTSVAPAGALTEIDQVALFKAVTKWQWIAEAAAEISALLHVALTTGRPAPVVLIIPEDVLDETTNATMPALAIAVPAQRPTAGDRAVECAATALAAAHRPAMLVGSGAHWSGAYGEIQDFADRLAVPVATSIHGKGAISERNE